MDKAALLQLSIGLLCGAVVAFLSWRARALSRSGAWAAAVSGGLIFGLGGWDWVLVLLTFFISSSLLSRAFPRRKTTIIEKFSKGSQRDWGQVLANGGLGALLVLAHAWLPSQPWPWVAYAGAIAAVNADTWATELGIFSKWPPRLITNGALVERGSSGGVSLLGSLAAFVGAALIAFATALASYGTWATITAIILGGLAGSFFDSFLGATVQASYLCSNCQKETERHPLHTCGAPTLQMRGWRWLNNDWVNFVCSLTGALASLVIWRLF
jgi:uncharacterized protein (TIGR00297 family)